MGRDHDSCAEILARLTPTLLAVFHAYGISRERAQAICDDACCTLLSKARLRIQNPEGWLLRTVIEACRLSDKEETVEDPPP